MGPAAALFDAATRSLGDGDLAAAETGLRGALALAPGFAEAHANLALVLERSGRPEEAEAHHRRALDLAPGSAQLWTNFAAMLEHGGRDAESESAYRRALALEPTSAAAWTSLGVLLEILRRDSEAEHCQRVAMTLAPGWAPPRVNLATLLLRQGRWTEGWPLFEARDWYPDLEAALGLPRWRGGDLVGRRILIGVEAGHGDMIQFVRYAACLRAGGAAAVGVMCHPALAGLLRTAAGVDAVLPLGPPAPGASVASPAWDCWCPALSLPLAFGTTPDTVPAPLPYLAPDPERARQWAGRLESRLESRLEKRPEARLEAGAAPRVEARPESAPAEGLIRPSRRPRVGLVWQGSPGFAHDRERSLGSADDLAPLAALQGVDWVVLNKGPRQAEAPPLPAAMVGAWIEDFADSAAVLANLDLLIAVDTAAAHLAGALGRPCWLLLPARRTDWRWLSGRDDSPWYPRAMRLFRQRPGQTWRELLGEVAAALPAALSAPPSGEQAGVSGGAPPERL